MWGCDRLKKVQGKKKRENEEGEKARKAIMEAEYEEAEKENDAAAAVARNGSVEGTENILGDQDEDIIF